MGAKPEAEREEALPSPSGPGSVLLDIGGVVGAVVVVAPSALCGAEVEVRPLGSDWVGRHASVLERKVEPEAVFAAVLPDLLQGSYELRLVDDDPEGAVLTAEVRGGEVTWVCWQPDATRAGT